MLGLKTATDSVSASLSSISVANLSGLVTEFNAAKQAGTMTGVVYDEFIAKVNTLSNGNIALVSSFQQLAASGETARASLTDCYAVMLNGNTKGMTNVKSMIAQYNALNVTTGVASSEQIAFAAAITQTNSKLGVYLGNLDGATATVNGYGRSLISATASAVGLKIATIALNSAIGMGIGLAISGITTLVMGWVNAEQNAIDSNKELASSFKDTSAELDSLKQQYIEIIDSAKSETEKDEELASWKDTLVTKYGLEKEALADVNKERGKGIELIDDEIYKNALTTINKTQDYSKAENEIYNASTTGGLFGLSYAYANGERKAIEGLKEYNIALDEFQEGSANFIYDTNNIYEQLDNIDKALADYKAKAQASKNYNGEYNWTIKYLQSEYDRITNIVNNFGETASAGATAYAQKYFTDFSSMAGNARDSITDAASYKKWRDNLIKWADCSEPIKNALIELADSSFPQYSSAVEDATNSNKSSLPSINNLTDAYTELADAISDVLKLQKQLSSAFEKVSKGESLDSSEIYDLLTAFPDLAPYVSKTEDGWTVAIEGLEKANKDAVADIKAQLEDNTKQYQEVIDTYNQKVAELGVIEPNAVDDNGNYKSFRDAERVSSTQSDVDYLAPQVEEANAQIEKNKILLDILNQPLETHAARMDSIQQNYDDAVKSINTYNSSIQTIQKAIKSMNESTALTYDEMIALVEIDPDIQNSIQQRSDGYYIEISALEALMQARYDERNAVIETEKDKTKALIEGAWNTLNICRRELETVYQNTTLMKTLAGQEIAESTQQKYNDALAAYNKLKENLEKLDSYKSPVYNGYTNPDKNSPTESDKLQQQIDYYNTILQAIESITDKEIDGLEKEKSAIQDKIDALEKEKDAIADKNEEQQRELDLIEARNNLDKAKKQKVFVYKKGEGLVQVEDTKAVNDAQQEYDKALNEIETAKIDKQISDYQNQQDEIDKQIEGKETYKDQFSNMQTTIDDILVVEQAKLAMGTDEQGLANLSPEQITEIQNKLATATLAKDKEDNTDNPYYKEISLSDFLASLGGSGNIADVATSFSSSSVASKIGTGWTNTNTSNVVNNNGTVTVSPTFNISGAGDPEAVANTVTNKLFQLFTDITNKTK